MKSILIFDTPTRCYDCPLYTSIADEVGLASEYGFCDDRNILKLKEAQEKIRFNQKPKWCPLKPLPNRKEDLHYPCNEYLQAVNEGWNNCLDEITDHIGESTEKVCNDDLYESWMFFDEGETE